MVPGLIFRGVRTTPPLPDLIGLSIFWVTEKFEALTDKETISQVVRVNDQYQQ